MNSRGGGKWPETLSLSNSCLPWELTRESTSSLNTPLNSWDSWKHLVACVGPSHILLFYTQLFSWWVWSLLGGGDQALAMTWVYSFSVTFYKSKHQALNKSIFANKLCINTILKCWMHRFRKLFRKKYTPVNGQAWSPPPSNDWTHQLNIDMMHKLRHHQI